MIYMISRVLFTIYLKTCFGFEVKGEENIPKKGPFIIVANHVSYGDPVVIGVTFKHTKITFVAKKELFHIPFFNLWFKHLGCIPIERWSGSSKPLKSCLRKLKTGGVLGIFPEGTRSLDGRLQKAQGGIGLIVAKTNAPIVPMYIFGTEKALPRGGRIPKFCKVKTRVGKPVDIKRDFEIGSRREEYEFIGEQIMEAIGKLKDEL